MFDFENFGTYLLMGEGFQGSNGRSPHSISTALVLLETFSVRTTRGELPSLVFAPYEYHLKGGKLGRCCSRHEVTFATDMAIETPGSRGLPLAFTGCEGGASYISSLSNTAPLLLWKLAGGMPWVRHVDADKSGYCPFLIFSDSPLIDWMEVSSSDDNDSPPPATYRATR